MRSTKEAMLAISMYFLSSSFFAEDATAIFKPAFRTRCSKSGTAEKGRTSGKYSIMNLLLRHSSSCLP